MVIRKNRIILLLAAAISLSGCATNSLYNWGPYENQVYAHFKNESPDAQIQILEKHAQETVAKGKLLPPGYRAHLGLLYAKVGRDQDFLVALNEEKMAFPESQVYIDSLISRAKTKKDMADEKK